MGILIVAHHPLNKYDEQTFIEAMRKKMPIMLGLSVMGWINKGEISKSDITNNMKQLMSFMADFLVSYRDTMVPIDTKQNVSIDSLTCMDDIRPLIFQKLVERNIEMPLAEIASSKLIDQIRKNVMIIEQGKDDPIYLQHFLEAYSRLDELAQSFAFQLDDLFRLVNATTREDTINKTYLKFLESHYEMIKAYPDDIELQRGLPPSGKYATYPTIQDSGLDALNKHVQNYRKQLPQLYEHTQNILARDPKARTQILEHYFEMFLFGKTHTAEVLAELTRLMHLENKTYSVLLNERLSRQTEHTRYVAEQVKSSGGMNYSDYMKLCLYDKAHGYYSRPREEIIPRQEFITCPEQYTDFGRGVAHDLFNRWQKMGRPAHFDIIEMGAGSGKLAKDLLDEVQTRSNKSDWRDFYIALDYQIVEISPSLTEHQQHSLTEHSSKVRWMNTSADKLEETYFPNSVKGVFLSNELPDAFPVHVVKVVDGNLREVFVSETDGILIEEYREISTTLIEKFMTENGITLAEGEIRAINLQAQDWMNSMARILSSGDIITIDYGQELGCQTASQNTRHPVRTYGKHRNKSDYAFNGTTGSGDFAHEFSTKIMALQNSLGREGALAAISDSLKGKSNTQLDETLGKEKRIFEYFMADISSSPINYPSETDLTSDADFLPMQLEGRRKGLIPLAPIKQSTYFNKMNITFSSQFTQDPFLGFFVQTFHKEIDATQQQNQNESLSIQELVLLEQNQIQKPSDVITLLQFTANHNVLGLGEASTDLLSRLKFDSVTDLLDMNIIMGMSIADALASLSRYYAKEKLPAELKVDTPKIDLSKPAKDIYEQYLDAIVYDEALKNKVKMLFCNELMNRGYSISEKQVSKSELDFFADKSLTELMDIGKKNEPLSSFHSIKALYNVTREFMHPRATTDLKFEVDFLDDFKISENGELLVNFDRVIGDIIRFAGTLDIKSLVSNALDFIFNPELLFEINEFAQKPTFESFIKIREPLTNKILTIIDQKSVVTATSKENEAIKPSITLTDRTEVAEVEADLIKSEPVNTRNQAIIFGKFADYVRYGLKFGNSVFGKKDLYTYIRLLDSSCDAEYLSPIIDEVMSKSSTYERHDPELLELLYEKGFKDAARKLLATWPLESTYYSPKIIQVLDKQGERDLISKYIDSMREKLDPKLGDDHYERRPFIFDKLSDTTIAKEQFELEWNYVKNVLRLFNKGKEAGKDTARFSDLCQRGQLTIDSNTPWDIFNPTQSISMQISPIGSYESPSDEGNFVYKLEQFITTGLKDDRFRTQAISCIAEMSASPMKLHLLEKASTSLPSEWSNEEREQFLRMWSATLEECGQQIQDQHFMEPDQDCPLLKNPRRAYPEVINKFRHLLPKNFTESRYYREHLSTCLEWATKELTANGLDEGSPEYIALKAKMTPIDNRVRVSVKREGGSGERIESMYLAGNHYVLSQARILLEGIHVESQPIMALLNNLEFPKDNDFKWGAPVESSKDIFYNYFQNAQTYLSALHELNRLAMREGYPDIVEIINDKSQTAMSQLSKRVEPDHIEKEFKVAARTWDSRLALNDDIANIRFAESSTQREEQTRSLMSRLVNDRRGFFEPAIIAEAAEWLSQDDQCASISLSLFKLVIDKLSPERGNPDWLPNVIAKSLEKASLSDQDRDSLNLYALETMWPESEKRISHWLNTNEVLTTGQKMLFDVVDDPLRFPLSHSFFLEKISSLVKKLDPTLHGENIKGGQIYLMTDFEREVALLDQICRRLVRRSDIWNPNNFEQLLEVFPERKEAIDTLRGIFPEHVETIERQSRHTALPSPEAIAQGDFDPRSLESELRINLSSQDEDERWSESVGVLNAWFTHDAISLLKQNEKKETKKDYSKQRDVVMTSGDYQQFKSFEILNTYWPIWLKESGTSQNARDAILNVLSGDSKEASKAKGFLAFQLLGREDIPLPLQEKAFFLIAKHYLPSYVTDVFNQHYLSANPESQREFYSIIALWNHTYQEMDRPTTLWAHIFEASTEDRHRLVQNIKQYLLSPDDWIADLTNADDWKILHHHLNRDKHNKTYFDHYTSGFVYLNGVENYSLKERLISLLSKNKGSEIVLTHLLNNWPNIQTKSIENDCWQEYRQLENNNNFNDETRFRIFNTEYNKWTKYLNVFHNSITNNEPFSFEISDRMTWEDSAAFQLLKSFNPKNDSRQSLSDILRLRFPRLTSVKVEQLHNLAKNPFNIEDSDKGDAGWWSQDGYLYKGEQTFHNEIKRIAGDALDGSEKKALIEMMYPYSKTYCLMNDFKLQDKFPLPLPVGANRPDHSRSARSEISIKLLGQFNKSKTPINEKMESALMQAARLKAARSHALEVGPVMMIAEEIPKAAGTHLAREHTIDISPLLLPESFAQYQPFAKFLIKTYLNVLNAGMIESIGSSIKGKPADEALKQFFTMTGQEKFAQMLRARPEVPKSYQESLRGVEDKVAPSDRAEVQNTIMRANNWQPDSFRLEKNLNAGSMGEVWLVNHKSYSVPLAIKVLTPSKLERVKASLKEIKRVRDILSWYKDISREAVIAHEVATKLIQLIENEIDFRVDFDNWKQWVGTNKPNESRLKSDGIVPLPNGKFWTPMYFEGQEHALNMSYVPGVGLNDVMDTISGKPIGLDLADDLWGMLKHALFESTDGVFPMDLHPGNVMFLQKELARLREANFKPTRVLVDTGQMGQLYLPSQRENMVDFLSSAASEDPIGNAMNRFEKLGFDDNGNHPPRTYDRSGLEHRMNELRHSGDLFDNIGLLTVEAPMNGLHILPPYLDAVKAFYTLRGGINKLDPNFTFN